MEVITVEEAIALERVAFVDVRSPGEYAQSRLPGAVSVPLLDDSERAAVGTLYRQDGPTVAKDKGISLVSPKLPDMVRQLQELSASHDAVVVYCWRGGMRSRSVASLMASLGCRTYQLRGGYKAYRRYVLDTLASFTIRPQLVVLCGSTGVGKTAVLQRLPQRGIAVVDLEKMANHRGSVFGQVGLGRGASAADFDAAILRALQEFQDRSHLVVECESKRIGNIYLPDVLYGKMREAPRLLLQAPVETRVQRLLEEYADGTERRCQEIGRCLQMLENRFGQRKTARLQELFAAGDLPEVVRMLLQDYYDPLYGYETAAVAQYAGVIDAVDLDQAADDIAKFLAK